MKHHPKIMILLLAVAVMLLQGCAEQANPEVNVYSSRKEALIKPMLDRFTAATGIRVRCELDDEAMVAKSETKAEQGMAKPLEGQNDEGFQVGHSDETSFGVTSSVGKRRFLASLAFPVLVAAAWYL